MGERRIRLMFNEIRPETIIELKEIVGEKNLVCEKEKMEDYSHDEYSPEWIRKYPEAVAKPENADEISAILKLANREGFPVTPRGGATGLCGGCVPSFGGLVISFENMKKIVEVDRDNLMVTAESGVTLAELYKEIEKYGMFFPPHPGDESATVGGVIATNAGGSRAIKYGVIRNFLRGLEVVLPDGRIINIGGKIMKNSTGYSLLNLITGSEGTLGVITKSTISLLPAAKSMITLVVPYNDLNDAIRTVPEIMRSEVIPMAIEFIEKDVIPIAEKYLDKTWPSKAGNADLMIILDGSSEDELMRAAEAISQVCTRNNAIDVFVADSREKQKNILDIRSQLYESIKKYVIEILDIVVPRADIAKFVKKAHEIADKYGMWVPTYGHAADGNVHNHIMRARIENGQWKELDEKEWKEKYLLIRKELHEYARLCGGMVSGEHGMGQVKKEYLAMFLGRDQVALMQSIKKLFDPNNILNPGKIFDI